MAYAPGDNLGLYRGWVRGEDFWGGPMNENLLMLDSVINMRIESGSFSAPPTDTEDGQIYAVAAGATGPWAGQSGKLAVRVDETWSFIDPKYGWRARFVSLNMFMWFNGTAWVGELNGFDPNNPTPTPTGPAYFDLALSVSDDMLANEPVIHMPLLTGLILPGNMAGSMLDMISPMPVTASLRVFRNGIQIGLITVQQDDFNATFTTTNGNPVTFARHDRLTIRAPAVVIPGFNQFGLAMRFNTLP